MTAKKWKATNPDLKGNMRDHATTIENALIANVENLNAVLIRKGTRLEAREQVLADMIEFQHKILNQKYLPE